MYVRYMESPLGRVTISSDGAGLLGVAFEEERHPRDRTGAVEADDSLLIDAERQLQEYFGGWRQSFDLPLNPQGTAFQKQVWKELCEIPFGQTISYLDLAKRIGNEKAVRTVGMANGRNPISVIVPCHRGIGSDGKLGGYGGGVWRKAYLLAHDGAQRLKRF